ncbi:MAG: bifunctional metallophosphatase/5'-nucleotidase, partial [Deltaproteobacteria bacterium]
CSAPPAPVGPAAAGPRRITIVATTDLHGHVEALPVLAGYIDNLRAERPGTLVVDSGDMFQGTLESNLGEGDAVVAAYAAIGYAAAAIGNHEFDFGPVGPSAVADAPGDDPRGALKARAAEAPFPLLMSNVVDAESGRPPAWPNVVATALVSAGGVRVGLVGATSEDTPVTTMPANFAGLRVEPIAPALARAASDLRARGAEVVVALVHAGGACRRFDDPDDLSSCDAEAEIFSVARALPPGLVDAIAAGHTHGAIAHRVAGIPIVQAYAYGRAFSRLDLDVTDGGVTAHIAPPHELCVEVDDCTYEGRPVRPSAAVEAAIAPAVRRAAAVRARPVGVDVVEPIQRAYAAESALGNLFADLMREYAGTDVALTNGGGLRADLPAGPLTYGALYEAMPFDNRFAIVRLRARDLARVIADNLRGKRGILSVSGVRAIAACGAGGLDVSLVRDGEPVDPDAPLTVATSDFLATGGDGGLFRNLGLPPDAIELRGDPTIRDAMAERLRARGGRLAPADVFDPARPRIGLPSPRPVRCGAQAADAGAAARSGESSGGRPHRRPGRHAVGARRRR